MRNAEPVNNFAADRVLVVTTGNGDKVWEIDDFKEVELANLSVLASYDNGTQILILYLKEPGKDKVLEAIEKLEKRSDTQCATPDHCLGLPPDALWE